MCVFSENISAFSQRSGEKHVLVPLVFRSHWHSYLLTYSMEKNPS